MLEDTRGSLRDELEEALLSMRQPPAPQQQPFNSLRDEIQRIRAYSHENQLTDNDAAQREDTEKQNKRIDSVRVDIELKSLVNRIKGVTTHIKEKVKKQRELSESIISEQDE